MAWKLCKMNGKGILALLVAEQSERIGGTEQALGLVMFEAGLSASDAAAPTGKDYEAVKSTIRLAKRIN
jgi:hypothetical protein